MIYTSHFTTEELALLIALAANNDPDNYTSPLTKSVIYKCKGIMAASATPKGKK